MHTKINILNGFSRSTSEIKLSIVVPVFNESESVEIFVNSVTELFQKSKFILSEIIFVNDGSIDATLEILLGLKAEYPIINIIDLSRNFGKEAAISAGLSLAKGNVVVPIDVDLQDPPQVIFEMIERWGEGYDVVLGRRVNRDSDSWFKKKSAEYFYAIHNVIADIKIPSNVGDFRLLDQKVVRTLNGLQESRRFMKGLFAWVGFKTACVDYVRVERVAGSSKFNGWRLWNFALEGVTSFSTSLLRFWTYLGVIVALGSFIFAVVILIKVLFYGIDVPGYASIMVAVTFLGGLQLVGIGILGEYLGRIYIESKRRPIFIIQDVY
jgi:glycosyltransferase involved in cell wall biosynthesis